MNNISDYVDWRGDFDFEVAPLNEVDAVIFAQLAMMDFDDILPALGEQKYLTIKEAAQIIEMNSAYKYSELGLIIPSDIIPLFMKMSRSRRFKDLLLGNYINLINEDEQIQFCALTIDLPKKCRVVAFSGTDDTLIGWKENFNMICLSRTAAQRESIRYLEVVADNVSELIVCGHSKGGNLALYSTIHINNEIFNKIIQTYCIDGPGLTEDVNEISDFNSRIQKVLSIIPQTSIIGRLFNHYEETTVIHSKAKGLYQHDVFSWSVLGSNFVLEEGGPSSDAIHIENKIKNIIEKLSDEDKERFVDVFYRMLIGTSASTLTELNDKKMKIIKSYFNLDSATKKQFYKISTELLLDRVIRRNLYDNIHEFSLKNKANNQQKKKIANSQ